MEYGWAVWVCIGFVVGVSSSLGLMVLGAMFAFVRMRKDDEEYVRWLKHVVSEEATESVSR